ncbi:unnamed protein product [Arabidopsis halleri]
MIKTREEYLSLSNSLWIVLERSITMAAMVAFLLKPLNTSNPTVASTQSKLILIPVEMKPANFVWILNFTCLRINILYFEKLVMSLKHLYRLSRRQDIKLYFPHL